MILLSPSLSYSHSVNILTAMSISREDHQKLTKFLSWRPQPSGYFDENILVAQKRNEALIAARKGFEAYLQTPKGEKIAYIKAEEAYNTILSVFRFLVKAQHRYTNTVLRDTFVNTLKGYSVISNPHERALMIVAFFKVLATKEVSKRFRRASSRRFRNYILDTISEYETGTVYDIIMIAREAELFHVLLEEYSS